MSRLDERFYSVRKILQSSGVTSATSSTTAKLVDGSKVTLLPGEAGDGLTFKWTIAGTKTNANGAFSVTLVGNGTTIATATADAATASDWMAELVVRFTNKASQKIISKLILDTEDPEVNYETATVDFAGGGQIIAYVTAVNGSDTITEEMCIVEKWYK